MLSTWAARLEPGHAQHVTLPEPVSLAVIDVSFISLSRVLPGVLATLTPDGEVIALVKPQFEARRDKVAKGVVRDPDVRRAAVERVGQHAAALGLRVAGEVESPIEGPAGNREYLLHLVRA